MTRLNFVNICLASISICNSSNHAGLRLPFYFLCGYKIEWMWCDINYSLQNKFPVLAKYLVAVAA